MTDPMTVNPIEPIDNEPEEQSSSPTGQTMPQLGPPPPTTAADYTFDATGQTLSQLPPGMSPNQKIALLSQGGERPATYTPVPHEQEESQTPAAAESSQHEKGEFKHRHKE